MTVLIVTLAVIVLVNAQRFTFDPRLTLSIGTTAAATTTTTAPGTPAPTPVPVPPELTLVGADGPGFPGSSGVYPGQLVRLRLQNAAPLFVFSQHYLRLFMGGFEVPVFFDDDVPITCVVFGIFFIF
jgi:hypothetical protein